MDKFTLDEKKFPTFKSLKTGGKFLFLKDFFSNIDGKPIRVYMKIKKMEGLKLNTAYEVKGSLFLSWTTGSVKVVKLHEMRHIGNTPILSKHDKIEK